MRRRIRWAFPLSLAVVAAAAVASTQAGGATGTAGATKTPIKHLVVIFQENVSFDHYFGTYPKAVNTDGQAFTAAPGTPAVDGLPATNPNLAQPARLDSSPFGLAGSPGGQITCDQDHNYNDEQRAFDKGEMDKFVETVGTGSATHRPGAGSTNGGPPCDPRVVMDYYDGNTTTAMWNYAQHYAMSDNSFSPTFGPSSPGAINLVSGDTGGVDMNHAVNGPTIATAAKPNADLTPDGTGGYSLTSDAQPYWDDCSTRDAVAMSGQNIGDELNSAGLSWGWFQGGFKPTTTFAAAAPGESTSSFTPDEFKGKFATSPASDQGICNAVTPVGVALGETSSTHQFGFKDDYIPHHEPFQYYATTANPHHLAPASLSAIGTDTQSYDNGTPQFDTANHNYDTSDFDSLVAAINAGQLPPSALPAVTFLKAPGYQDGHAAYSDPADEQAFVVKEVNSLMASPDWSSTAIVIAYDDSDGWYDHVYSGVTNPSQSVADALTGPGTCGTGTPLAGQQGRCGFGPRQPLLVISPCAKQNAVDHNLSDLASIPNFIEYNWGLPPIAGSFDQALASKDASDGVPFDFAGLFDFSSCDNPAIPLDSQTGQVHFTGPVNGLDLHGNTLAHAELAGASLEGVNLNGAFLVGADLQGATLQGVNLRGADLSGANLEGATLKGVNTNGVTWSKTTCPDGTTSDADGGTCQGHLT